jgi:HSP20 family molecular chaperone IbpA
MRRAAISALLLGAIVAAPSWPPLSAARARGRHCTGDPLPVVVEEGQRQIRLRIRVGQDVDPGSVEVELDGSRVSVEANAPDADRRLCSGDLWLRSAVVEEKPLADYEDGWLTITLSRASSGDDAK